MPPPKRKEGEEELKPGGFDIKIAREISKTAMDFIFNAQNGWLPHWKKIHLDRDHEFSGVFRKWANSRGIVLTRTPGDNPRANDRMEVAVKSFKAQIRRLLKQAVVGNKY